MTEILLLGSFHFLESSFDFYSEKIQDQLEEMAAKLVEFHPDTIALEAALGQQEAVRSSYEKFSLSDLRNYEKMRTSSLGEICMFGKKYPITYNNECIQIGYRLGKLLNIEKVFAIDDDSIADDSIWGNPNDRLMVAIEKLKNDMELHKEDSLADLYKYYNSNEWSKLNHSVYIQANTMNQQGVQYVTKWYERNLKIFSHIQSLAEKSERIFILYGAGHLKLLKDLIRADENMNLVDVRSYL